MSRRKPRITPVGSRRRHQEDIKKQQDGANKERSKQERQVPIGHGKLPDIGLDRIAHALLENPADNADIIESYDDFDNWETTDPHEPEWVGSAEVKEMADDEFSVPQALLKEGGPESRPYEADAQAAAASLTNPAELDPPQAESASAPAA